MATDGNNNNSGISENMPWKTFSYAFSQMSSSDELILLPGNYPTSVNGHIGWTGINSGQPPSGISATARTIVKSRDGAGSVHVIQDNNGENNAQYDSALYLGLSFEKVKFIKIDGISFEGGGSLANTQSVYIKNCGFLPGPTGLDGFGIGVPAENISNTDNLIEDVWITGDGSRIASVNYRADNNVWRRVVITSDGCGSCTSSGNYEVGDTTYNSKNVYKQNIIVIDRKFDASAEGGYADFATAQHDANFPETPNENNYWQGTISINSQDSAYHHEADNSNGPSNILENIVAVGHHGQGLNLGGDRDATLEYFTFVPDGYVTSHVRRYDNSINTTTRFGIIRGNAKWGLVRPGSCDDIVSFGDWDESQITGGSCNNIINNMDPFTSGLLYPLRVESDSDLDITVNPEHRVGAEIIYRMGAEGSFYGDPGFNTLTTIPLWPWPNESVIRDELCEAAVREFCSYIPINGGMIGSLTSYIWEWFGNAMPDDIYSDNSDILFTNSFEDM